MLAKILIPIFVLLVLAVSFWYALDPQESRNLEKDKATRDEAVTILDAIGKYRTKFGNFPWEVQNLPWTIAQSIFDRLVEAEFSSTGQVKEAGKIYLGRGTGENDKIWACFLPVSKHERVDSVRLKSLTVGTPVPGDGEPSECLNSPDWQNSFCYVCVSE